ncbi:DNA-3-methyladenine glycosylase I [Pediococcus argentinicus]|uniref:Dna-3-methyladenine glycosylase i n=1 Tax=Pediococcus argentinicus TaxID=480391 RepID=A0A0R2NG12_9LACO|nr:DNA-3-methyladenine glycosylase I [Pediococcus argentinicus]KRO24759.1 dna-3-methyladenine glycosylase i [Pediococcus argentinicus]NKZ22741.1 DNA-3-methyladenine glycosylase I [Pediococcus argentinicus]GEP19789.1 DNA-3-methyladenine glycosylase I [Pediococcus argentinicus]
MDSYVRCSRFSRGELLQKYHDEEWGIAELDSQKVFAALSYQTFQAGLEWNVILKKRAGLDEVFFNFDYNKVSEFDVVKINSMLHDSRIIRNRRKVMAVINNARIVKQMHQVGQPFGDYIWSLVDYEIFCYSNLAEIDDALNILVKRIMKDLKQKGFQFVGIKSTKYFLQAIGIINGHESDCFRYNRRLTE